MTETLTPEGAELTASGRGRRWALPVLVFAATRVIDAVLLLVMARHQVLPPHSGYADMLTNWDGHWYRLIAEHGYPHHLPVADGAVVQNQWAFFPLYPALVRAVMVLSPLPYAAAASTVSLLAGAGAMVLVFGFLESRVGRFNAAMAVLALGLAPAGVAFQLAYTESLALLLVIACLVLLSGRRYGWFTVAALALSLTRPVVLPLALVVLAHGVVRWRRRSVDPFPASQVWACVGSGAVAVAGFGLWPAVCAAWTGDRAGYLETQRTWIDDVPGEPTWLLQVVRHPTSGAALLAVVATALVTFLVLRRGAAWGLEARVWTLAYAGYLLVATLPAPSMLRYSLLEVFPWWPGSSARPRSGAHRVAVVGAVLVVGVVTQLVWLRTFYVVGPHFYMNP